MLRSLLPLTVGALVACTAVTTSAPVVAPDSDFDLAVGAAAQIAGSAVSVRFDSVTEDSRCPADVQCVWEGNATVRLTLDSAGVARRADLRTAGARQPATAFGWAFAIRALRPVPLSGTSIRHQDYVVTLRASRPGGP